MVKKLKDIGIKRVNFSTNATALTEKKSLELLNSGLDEIRFSIDGYTKKTFEKIRKDATFEKVINNVLRFIELRNKSNFKTQVQIRLVEQKENEIKENKFNNKDLERLANKKIGRNEPCPCGSGKKFKHCCGAL